MTTRGKKVFAADGRFLIRLLYTPSSRRNLCADAGYDSEEARTIMRKYGYVPHVRSRCEDKKELAAGKKARRWIVEVAHSWFNRFRKILVRFEKKKSSFEGLLQLAAAIIVFRKRGIIYG